MKQDDVVCGYCGKKNVFGTHICTDEQEKIQKKVWEEEASWAKINAYFYAYSKFIKKIKKLFKGIEIN